MRVTTLKKKIPIILTQAADLVRGVDFPKELKNFKIGRPYTAVFVNLRPFHIRESVKDLLKKDPRVSVEIYSNWGFEGDPINPGQQQDTLAIKELEQFDRVQVHEDTVTCMNLLEQGFASEDHVLVIDAMWDGVLTALWAVGLGYPEMKQDSEILHDDVTRNLDELTTRGLYLYCLFDHMFGKKQYLENVLHFMTQGEDEVEVLMEKLTEEGGLNRIVQTKIVVSTGSFITDKIYRITLPEERLDWRVLEEELEKTGATLCLRKSKNKVTLTVIRKFADQYNLETWLPEEIDVNGPNSICACSPRWIMTSEEFWTDYLLPYAKKHFANI